jgi:glutathione S-transferase
MRPYRFDRSRNVERVALALAHEKLPVESVEVDPDDRSEVHRHPGDQHSNLAAWIRRVDRHPRA